MAALVHELVPGLVVDDDVVEAGREGVPLPVEREVVLGNGQLDHVLVLGRDVLAAPAPERLFPG